MTGDKARTHSILTDNPHVKAAELRPGGQVWRVATVSSVEHIEEGRVRVRFDDGTEGVYAETDALPTP